MVLFIVYLWVSNVSVTKPVISYEEPLESSVRNVLIKFNNGINSKNLSNLFISYDEDYYVEKINNTFVSCDEINSCLKIIYDEKNEEFSNVYLANGFRVNEVNILTYLESIKTFLEANDINYELETRWNVVYFFLNYSYNLVNEVLSWKT